MCRFSDTTNLTYRTPQVFILIMQTMDLNTQMEIHSSCLFQFSAYFFPRQKPADLHLRLFRTFLIDQIFKSN